MLNKSKKLLNEFNDLVDSSENEIEAKNIFKILKTEAKKISVDTLQELALFFKEDFKYIQKKYQNDYLYSMLSQMLKVVDIKNDNELYNHKIDKKKFQKAILNMENFLNYDNLFDEKEDLEIVSILIAFYHSFIVFKPTHPVGMSFPGEEFEIRSENGIYYCPTKIKQISNPNSLCSFCVCKSE